MKIEIQGNNLRKLKRGEARVLLSKLFDLLSPIRRSGNNSIVHIDIGKEMFSI